MRMAAVMIATGLALAACTPDAPCAEAASRYGELLMVVEAVDRQYEDAAAEEAAELAELAARAADDAATLAATESLCFSDADRARAERLFFEWKARGAAGG